MKRIDTISDTTIGIAGCGTMGLPMAECLQSAGFRVLGHDVRPPADYEDSPVKMVFDPTEFAAGTDVLISVVRDIQQTRNLLFGSQNLMGHPNAPATVVVSSTVSPGFILELRTELADTVALIDAPMSGAPYRARLGELSFMLGGDDDDIAPLLPMFETMGSEVFRLGGLSAGMTTKVLNNYCAATGLVATRRVLQMSEALNLDRRRLLQVMHKSSGANWYASHIDDIDWSREGYDRSNTIGIVEKDVNSALDAVKTLDALPDWPLDRAILDALQALKPLKLEQEDTNE